MKWPKFNIIDLLILVVIVATAAGIYATSQKDWDYDWGNLRTGCDDYGQPLGVHLAP